MYIFSSILLSSREPIIVNISPATKTNHVTCCNSSLALCKQKFELIIISLVFNHYHCNPGLVWFIKMLFLVNCLFLTISWAAAISIMSYIAYLCTLNMVYWEFITTTISQCVLLNFSQQSVLANMVVTQVTNLQEEVTWLMTMVLKRTEMSAAAVALMLQLLQ